MLIVRAVIGAHLRKLRQRDEISQEEEQAIRGMIAEVRSCPADRVLVQAGELLHESLLLLDGWMARMKDLPSGQRHFCELHVAGDFVDLHAFTLKRLDHDVMSLTQCRYAVVPHDRLAEVTSSHPHLARVYWFSTNVDAAIHREAAVSLGRRSAIARLAHLLCELFLRLRVVGIAEANGFDLPLIQEELADCLGMTAVHLNRSLQELRRRRLLDVENRRVTILDERALVKLAEFDPGYLYLERQPR